MLGQHSSTYRRRGDLLHLDWKWLECNKREYGYSYPDQYKYGQPFGIVTMILQRLETVSFRITDVNGKTVKKIDWYKLGKKYFVPDPTILIYPK